MYEILINAIIIAGDISHRTALIASFIPYMMPKPLWQSTACLYESTFVANWQLQFHCTCGCFGYGDCPLNETCGHPEAGMTPKFMSVSILISLEIHIKYEA